MELAELKWKTEQANLKHDLEHLRTENESLRTRLSTLKVEKSVLANSSQAREQKPKIEALPESELPRLLVMDRWVQNLEQYIGACFDQSEQIERKLLSCQKTVNCNHAILNIYKFVTQKEYE